jgi:hypothetical protein
MLEASAEILAERCAGIDRVLGSIEWHMLALPGLFPARSLSTHFETYKCKRFRFESFWVPKKGFQEVVKNAWQEKESNKF